jgi:recombination protein RecA
MKEGDRQRDLLRTGFRALDEVLGGGLPRGEMVEVFGPAGCGKSTLAMQISACVQRAGLTAAWIDADHTFDPAWAAQLGVETGRLPLAQPNSAEAAMGIAHTLASSGAIDLIVIDSAAALVPELEMALRVGSVPGLHFARDGLGTAEIESRVNRADVCALILNQSRNRLERGGGETSAGGPPLKLYAAVRLLLVPERAQQLSLQVLKNKVAGVVPGRRLPWRGGVGFVESP